MLLAGDVGGTSARFGLFARDGARPRAVVTRTYATARVASIHAALAAFLRDASMAGGTPRVEAVCLGIAGPVDGDRAALTNGTWTFDAPALARDVGGAPVRLVNDLAAMAASVAVLRDDETAWLQRGVASPGGGAALLAAGTGLGMAALPRIDGRLQTAPSEGGHADFAPRTAREDALVALLRARVGRVRVEDVVSGPGISALHAFTHGATRCQAGLPARGAPPAAVSDAALAHRCGACVEALEMFVEAYGSEAGNLALRTLATAGVWIGGGIAAKILPALETGRFVSAFRDKPPMDGLLGRVPVRVILMADAGLLGAAVLASHAG
jgi:glucokinase